MGIIIINIIFFIFFIFVGIEAGCVGLSIVLCILFSVSATMLLMDAEHKCNTKEGQEQLRREQECEKKEWNEWRYRQDEEDK